MQFILDDPEPLLFHGEAIWRDGERVGFIRAGAYGHTLGAAVGLGYVESSERPTTRYREDGKWEIEIALQRHSASASLRPLYDPRGERIRS